MTQPLNPSRSAQRSLSPNVVVLGVVSLLMGMSSAMIYGVLPVFLVTVLGASTAAVGLIEGTAEATTSLVKIFSGVVSDWIGRRKPLVALGYGLSAVNKLLFPFAESASAVLVARIADRLGKGMRDAPRDALLADVTPAAIRGTGFGLRLALYTVGAVLGPLTAIALMTLSGDNFRLVFWVALIPGFASLVVLLVGVKEPAHPYPDDSWGIRRSDLALLTVPFWWAIAIAAIFSLARFSPAFLALKAHDVHVDAAFVPIILVAMYLAYCAASYPFGILADRVNRHLQLGIGAVTLIAADLTLAGARTVWMTVLGAALWGLQMGDDARASFGRHRGCCAGTAARHGLRDLRSGRRRQHVCRERRRRHAVDARWPQRHLRRRRLARSGSDHDPASPADTEAGPFTVAVFP